MLDIVIKAENLGKKYIIGHETERGRYVALRDVLMHNARTLWNKTKDLAKGKAIIQGDTLEEVWALKDVNFEINRGEAVGIIGRNGAGKSTLLKVLSRITEPSAGRVTIKGRVASLLEVGTGFHPELTGRENIYLNGTILGMTRKEVKRKFDEIIAFAEIEKYLDTPVKRYSSGMYMRLAFAVAAHLEPEILLVDEVLAVGDAAFQKKCLGKMGEVSKAGRTILFVSHNMQAIQSLCSTAIQLEKGYITSSGEAHSVVSSYFHSLVGMASEMTWPEDSAPGNNEIRLLGIRVTDEKGDSRNTFSSSKDILFEMKFIANTIHPALCVGFDLFTAEGGEVARSYQTDSLPEEWPTLHKGENIWRCVIPAGLLNAGSYYISPKIGMHNMYWIVNLDTVVRFEVLLDHGVSPFWNVLDKTNRPGVIAPIFRWYSQDSI